MPDEAESATGNAVCGKFGGLTGIAAIYGRRRCIFCEGEICAGRGVVRQTLPVLFEHRYAVLFLVIGLADGFAAVLGRAFNQVGEGVVGGIGGVRGVDVELFLGTRQRNIKQAQAFRHFFIGVLLLFVFRQLRLCQQFGSVCALVEDLPVGRLGILCVPRKRAVYQRILQTFRGVHGNDFDQIFVAFQTDGSVVVAVVFGKADLVAQPLVQGGGVAVLRVFGGKQFEQLEIVGQAAFVLPLQKACFDAVFVGKLLHGGKNAVLIPVVECGSGGFHPF